MDEDANMVELVVELTTAWLANPNTRCAPEDVHAFLKNSHATLVGLSQPIIAEGPAESEQPSEFTPAVSVRKSLADPEFIISLIDGKPYRTLRRHLSTRGLTPEEYRARYGLKPDYPMVAPGYSARRSQVAKELGFGRKGTAGRASVAASTVSAAKAENPDPAPVQEPTEIKPRAKRGSKSAAAKPEATQATE